MRRIFHSTSGTGALVLLLVTGSATAQFNPRGRSPRPPAQTPNSRSSSPRPSTTDNATSEKQRRDILIARYKKLVLDKPGEPTPLQRLVELVRQRDGHLQTLTQELKSHASDSGKQAYAAQLALALLAQQDGKLEFAERMLTVAHQKQPTRSEALLALSQVRRSLGETQGAREALEKALPLTRGVRHEETLRELRNIAAEAGDLQAARRYHDQLIQGARGNIYLLGELGRELLAGGRIEEAISELERIARRVEGDARALAPALRDLGTAQIEGGHYVEATKTLARASRLSVAQPGLRLQIDRLRADAHRGAGTLDAFLEELQRTARGSARLLLVGRLREEQGKTEAAIEAYRRAAAADPKNPDPLLALVRLLELTGDLEEATTQYKKLTRAAPRQIDLSLRYMEMLLAQGKRQEALREFDRAARVARNDPDSALLLIDLAQRIEEPARAEKLRAHQEARAGLGPRHLVELGSRAYRNGDHDKAHSLWKRILRTESDPVRAAVLYGETLLSHESITEGIASLEKAIELAPEDPGVQRSLARGLLRAASQSTGRSKKKYELQALKVWEKLLSTGNGRAMDQARRAEARRQIVRLYERTGQLGARIVRLEQEFHDDPPDLAAGRLLAEAQIERRNYPGAEQTLKELLEHTPGDREVLLALERVQTRQDEYQASMKTLERLLEVDPTRKAQTYQTLSERALAAQDDAAALRYAEKAFALNRGDAAAQGRLGDLYVKQGRLEEAEAAYRSALAKNDQLHTVSLSLARLLAGKQAEQEALGLLLKVLRSSPHPDQLATAGRLALTVGLAAGQARRIEDELRPLAISMPGQPLYRKLLLEAMTAQLVPLEQTARYGTAKKKQKAKEELAALADRSLQPLLAALASGKPAQEQRAIQILSYGTSESAGAALVEFASSAAPEGLRVEALLAAGRRQDPRLADRIIRLFSQDGTIVRGRLSRAALLCLSLLETEEAQKGLLLALDSDDPTLRMEVILGLSDHETILPTPALVDILSNKTAGPAPRAAAALALSKRQRSPQTTKALLLAAEGGKRLVRAAALVGLFASTQNSKQRAQKASSNTPPANQPTTPTDGQQRTHLAVNSPLNKMTLRQNEPVALATRALFESDPQLSRAALSSLTLGPQNQLVWHSPAERLTLTALSQPAEQLLWDRLLKSPTAPQRVRALVTAEEELASSAALALRTSKGDALKVLSALRGRQGAPALIPLFELARDRAELAPAQLRQARAATARIHEALLPALLTHADGSDPETRAAALRALTLDAGQAARSAIERASRSSETNIFEAGLAALSRSASEPALELLSRLIETEHRWHRQRRIAETVEHVALDAPSPTRSRARGLLELLVARSDGLAQKRAQQAIEKLGSQ